MPSLNLLHLSWKWSRQRYSSKIFKDIRNCNQIVKTGLTCQKTQFSFQLKRLHFLESKSTTLMSRLFNMWSSRCRYWRSWRLLWSHQLNRLKSRQNRARIPENQKKLKILMKMTWMSRNWTKIRVMRRSRLKSSFSSKFRARNQEGKNLESRLAAQSTPPKDQILASE